MAKKETATPALERTYNVPLRREYLKVPNWKRTEKAVVALRQFLQRHMKSEDISLGRAVNEKLWQHGIKNPPHHIKITAVKDDKGRVTAELFGAPVAKKEKESKGKKESPEKKASVKEEAAKSV